MFGLSTLNSNRTNHKLRKKQPNQKTPTYVLATLRDSNMILCNNSQTLYTEGLERRQKTLGIKEDVSQNSAKLGNYKMPVKLRET